MDVKTVRKYFLSNRVLPWVLIIVGIPFICMMGLGLILIIVGIILLMKESYAGESSVDQAWRKQADRLEARSMEKLNLIQEQTSIIDPVTLIGFGASPDDSFSNARAESRQEEGADSVYLGGFRRCLRRRTERSTIRRRFTRSARTTGSVLC